MGAQEQGQSLPKLRARTTFALNELQVLFTKHCPAGGGDHGKAVLLLQELGETLKALLLQLETCDEDLKVQLQQQLSLRQVSIL